MEKYNNVLSTAQRDALHVITHRFTMLASGATTGRFAFDLAAGCGKTQAVVAWCAELVRLQKPFAVTICAQKINELCALKRELLINGVPEAEIGLVHSDRDPTYDRPTEDNENRRILLLTHENVRRGIFSRKKFNRWNGGRRRLVIWDETCFISQHRAVGMLDFERSVAWISPEVKRDVASPALRKAFDYCCVLQAKFDEEYESQKAGNPQRQLFMPEVEPEALREMITALSRSDVLKPARIMLEISQEPLRFAKTAQGGGGFIHYDIVVPPELGNIVVLDASHGIRELAQMDETIRHVPFPTQVKRYDNVMIHYLKSASGRGEMTKQMVGQANRRLAREIAQVVKRIPEDQGVLIWTFKKKGDVNMPSIVAEELTKVGVDCNAMLSPDKPRIVIRTWGEETATSEWKRCSNVLFAGVLHRSQVDIAGAIAAQQNDLLADIPYADIHRVLLSEVVHSVYQAVNRAACRDTVNGQAAATNIWLPYPNTDIKPLLDLVMPGAVWMDWESTIKKPLQVRTSKTAETAKRIVEFVRGLDLGVTEVSLRSIKEAIGCELSGLAWQRARDKALEVLSPMWRVNGQSLRRVGDYFG
jgi:hypothetical protein